MITINEAEEILKREYHLDNFLYLVNEILLPDFKLDKHDVAFSSHLFESVTMLGTSKMIGVTIFEIDLNDGISNRRVAITQEAFKMLRGLRIDNALISFVSNSKRYYRISLLTSDYVYENDKIVKVLSNPRRYSYSLGYGTKTKTAYKFLIEKGKVESLNELIGRFSVEVVNKQFYTEIATLYTKLVGGERNGTTYYRQMVLDRVRDDKKYAEFGVRLIGRIVFCWFLRQKKSKNDIPLLPDDIFKLDTIIDSESYYHDVLEPLFFELLNTNQKRRKQEFNTEYYKRIPYLNGGLFSPHADDLYVYNKHGGVDIPNQWFMEFYSILSEYNFTVDENTSYDIELSIDPEMLGRIFENLLAEINPETGENAKKNTGSFYTPREIVDYMVDNCLSEYLTSKTHIETRKINAILNYSKLEEIDALSEDEKQKIISCLYKITILDPACGSGAFPIGMLQKIVYILNEIDPTAKMWLDISTKSVSPLLKREIENKFSVGSLNYIRKLSVIQNSIFGIDIQPIAVEISRLRCFLSLIIEEQVDDNDINRGINPLPNLDFKFIIANSLIGLDDDQPTMYENNDYIDQLKAVRDEYFSADNETRQELKLAFSSIQQDMLVSTIGAIISEKYSKLCKWKPFSNDSTDWFDADWMFGLKDGFDIVIGNPPYIDSETMTKTMKKEREQYAKLYQVAKGNWDIFLLFIEMAIKSLKPNGNTSFILPNKLIASNYAKAARQFMSQYSFYSLRDYSSVPVFEASVYPIVYLLSKSKSYTSCLIEKMDTLSTVEFSKHIDQTVFSGSDNWDSFFAKDDDVSKIIKKMNSYEKLSDVCGVVGAATVGEAYEIKELIKEEKYDEHKHLKFVNTGTIDRYEITWGLDRTQYLKDFYFMPIVCKQDVKNKLPNRYDDSISEKIIIGGMCKSLECYYDDGKCMAGKSTTVVTSYSISLKALTGVLNSKLISFYYRHHFSSLSLAGGFLRFGTPQIKAIPLPYNSFREHSAELEKYVDSILNRNNVEQCENAINDIVYSIYNLNKEEIKVIENEYKEIK